MNEQPSAQPAIYQFKVAGHLDVAWAVAIKNRCCAAPVKCTCNRARNISSLVTTRIKRLYKRWIKRLSNARSAKLGVEGQRVTIGTNGRLS